MSFFSNDVIAKEQLHGVVGAPSVAPVVPPPIPMGGRLRRRRKIHPTLPLPLDLYQDFIQYLEIKLKTQ